MYKLQTLARDVSPKSELSVLNDLQPPKNLVPSVLFRAVTISQLTVSYELCRNVSMDANHVMYSTSTYKYNICTSNNLGNLSHPSSFSDSWNLRVD